jgi:DNA-binding Lrp family transcriptional regulator
MSMVTAYILIISDSGAEKNIIDDLLEVDGVQEADVIYGEYDILAKISIPDVSMLGDFILENIRPIQGIKRTSTLISAEHE